MLGFRAKRWPNQGGAPDGLWWIDDWCGFTFEAKYGATIAEVSLDDLRQATSHPDFAKHEKLIPANLPVHIVLCSNHTKVHRDARALAEHCSQVTLDELRSLFSSAAMSLERLRGAAVDLTDEAACEEAWRCQATRKVVRKRH